MECRVWVNEQYMIYPEKPSCPCPDSKLVPHWFMLNLSGDLIAVSEDGSAWARIGHSWEVLMYSEEEDKNAKKIYEGDIVKYVLSDPYHIYEDCDRPGLGVIRLGEYLQDGSNGEYGPTKCLGFYIENIDGKADRHEQTISLIDGIDSLEIIGNEFENLELLPKSHD